MSNSVATIVAMVITVVFALSVIVVRIRAGRKPTSARKILLPPVMMSTGFLMYIFPFTHESLEYGIIAFLVGCILSYPLILTSKFYRNEQGVFLQRSKGFIYILLGLLVVRIGLHSVVEQYVDVYQTGSLFFDLAFGMLVPWRMAMFMRYRRLVQERKPVQPSV
ncbi:CcdC family protein [Alicyclobacillus fodiniaquatilis]|jgi:membrane protein CcdC involved in cytochrome C biogenesis|uniref:CcdC family protein n=1 Tax=Alicyclobacillus fodiniaquatilis TaxID=1661150 RepID=A0ABW4JKW5_9BACL